MFFALFAKHLQNGFFSLMQYTKASLQGLISGVVSTKASFVNSHLIGSSLPSILIDSISDGYKPAHVWPFGTRLTMRALSPGHARTVAYRYSFLQVKRMSCGVY